MSRCRLHRKQILGIGEILLCLITIIRRLIVKLRLSCAAYSAFHTILILPNIPINHCDMACYLTLFVFFPYMTWLVYWIWIDCSTHYLVSSMTSCTNEEYADVLYCCGYGGAAVGLSGSLAWFSDRHELDVSVFSEVYLRIQITNRVKTCWQWRVYAADDEEDNFHHFVDVPKISTFIVAGRLGVS